MFTERLSSLSIFFGFRFLFFCIASHCPASHRYLSPFRPLLCVVNMHWWIMFMLSNEGNSRGSLGFG